MSKSLVFFATLLFSVLVPELPAAQSLKEGDRARWLSEIREYKHEFLTKDLALTKDQQREFFPLYDRMEDEVEKINAETRALEAKTAEDKDASDTEIESAARTVFEQKSAEGQVEITYFDKFKEILSPRQLLKLKNAERRFTQNLVKHHNRTKREVKK